MTYQAPRDGFGHAPDGMKYGIPLEEHVREKFNRVSEARGFPERL